MAKRCGHYSGVGDDDVKALALCQQLISTGTHAFEMGEIQFNQIKASTVRSSILAHLCGGGFGLGKLPRRADNLGTVRCQRSRSLHAQSG